MLDSSVNTNSSNVSPVSSNLSQNARGATQFGLCMACRTSSHVFASQVYIVLYFLVVTGFEDLMINEYNYCITCKMEIMMKWFSGLFKQCIDVNRFPLKKEKRKDNFGYLPEAVISLLPSIFLSLKLKCNFLYLQRQAASRSIAIGQEH